MRTPSKKSILEASERLARAHRAESIATSKKHRAELALQRANDALDRARDETEMAVRHITEFSYNRISRKEGWHKK